MNSAVRLWCIKRIKRKTTVLRCFLLMMLSSAPLILTLIFSENMMSGISSKYICLSNGHIRVDGASPACVLKTLDSNLGSGYVASCDAVVSGSALMYSQSGTSSSFIKGVQDDYFNELRKSQIKLTENEVPDNGQGSLKGIIISRYCADKLKVKCGDHITLMIVPDSASGTARPVLVYVRGIFSSGYDQLDKMLSFVSYDYASSLFPSSDSLSTEIMIKSDKVNKIDSVCDALNGKFSFTTWENLNTSMYDNFAASRQFILILILVIAAVACFFTAGIAQQLIHDDLSDIAIMKLTGMSDKSVKKWAFTTVFSVTVSGIIAGTVLGTITALKLDPVLKWLSSKNIPSLSFYLLDFEISLSNIRCDYILLTVCFMLIVSFISIILSLRITKTITPIRLFNES